MDSAPPTAMAYRPGNINSLPGVDGGTGLNTSLPPQRCTQCRNVPSKKICYFPTSARLGIDNDNLIIVSSVINVNHGFDPTAHPQIAKFAGVVCVLSRRVVRMQTPPAGSIKILAPDQCRRFASPNRRKSV